jgi:hypothetical protein
MEHFYELVAAAVDEFPDNIAIEVQHRDRLEQVTYARLREMASTADLYDESVSSQR